MNPRGALWRERVELGKGGRRHLALCGFMGVGKSSVARLIAPALGLKAVDVDAEAEAKMGHSIDAEFQLGHGERFRDLEALLVAEILDGEPAVIALGGGAVLRPETLQRLLSQSVLVYLHVAWEDMRSWVAELSYDRPVIQGRTLDEVEAIYGRRLPIYRRAHLEVAVDRSGPQVAAAEVLAALGVHPLRPGSETSLGDSSGLGR